MEQRPPESNSPAMRWRAIANALLVLVIVGGNFAVTFVDPDNGSLGRWIQAVGAAVLALLNAPSLFRRARRDAGDPVGTSDPRPLAADASAESSTTPVPATTSSTSSPSPTSTTFSTSSTSDAGAGSRRTPAPVRYWRARPMWMRRLRLNRPAGLPRRPSNFAGREEELARLRGLLPEFRRLRDLPLVRGRDPERSTIIVVHGMPGVGKSALTLTFAQQIAAQFPDGQLYANLGSAGGTDRATGEVLKEFLLDLGWPLQDIPEDTDGRSDIFRSLTSNRRILLMLDAARDADQVRPLLPDGRHTLVLLTSRRDLSPDLGGSPLHLGVPSTAESVAILRAESGPDAAPRSVDVWQVVRRCGQLPLALCAAARLARDSDLPTDDAWADVARQLESDETRLDYFAHDGNDLRALLMTEYGRLIGQEPQALQRLALMEQETFLPWVLCPLLDVPLAEAENLIQRLGVVHLIEVASGIAGGPARYRFHPVVRLFAEEQAQRWESDSDIDQARRRLELAYRGVARAVLARIGEPVASPAGVIDSEDRWRPSDHYLTLVAQAPEAWVRMEHHHLVRAVQSAWHDQEYELAWRITARLGECVPHGSGLGRVEAAFNAGLDAARRAGQPRALASVRLARASVMISLEQYREARQLLTEVTAVAGEHDDLFDLCASGHRRQAEGALQAAAYASAQRDLDTARDYAMRAGARGGQERERVALLTQMCDRSRRAVRWGDPADHHQPSEHDDYRHFYAHLVWAEAARRREKWLDAHDALDRAFAEYHGDQRRIATLSYWAARLCMTRGRATRDAADRAEHAARAYDFAMGALLTFQDLGIARGEVRARCMLARVLLMLDEFDAAERELDACERGLEASLVDGAAEVADHMLRARCARARGELLVRRAIGRSNRRGRRAPVPAQRLARHGDRAIESLGTAVAGFLTEDDWWSEADALLWLGRAHRLAGRPPKAMEHLARALAQFSEASDAASIAEVLAEMSHLGRIDPAGWGLTARRSS